MQDVECARHSTGSMTPSASLREAAARTPTVRFHKAHRDKMAQSRSHHPSCKQTPYLYLQNLKSSINRNSRITNFQESRWYFLKWIQRGNGWPSTLHSLCLSFDPLMDLQGWVSAEEDFRFYLSISNPKEKLLETAAASLTWDLLRGICNQQGSRWQE